MDTYENAFVKLHICGRDVYDYPRCRKPCGRDHMVVGFTTTCAIMAYHN